MRATCWACWEKLGEMTGRMVKTMITSSDIRNNVGNKNACIGLYTLCIIFHCCYSYHCHYWLYQVSISINSCRSGWGTASSINLPHERWVDSVFAFQMFVNKLKKLISSIAPQYSSITVCWLCGVFELVESNKIQKDDRWSKYMSRMHVAWMGSSRTIPPKDDLQDLLGPFDGSTRTPVGLSAR